MKTPGSGVSPREFRYLTLLTGLFVATLLISNTVSQKPWQIGRFVFPAGSILFPLSYLFGDVLTEVYGYARARQVIWTGFLANGLMAITYRITIGLPQARFWPNDIAFGLVLGQVPRLVVASLVGYLIGEFANSFVLAKMKVWSGGRHLWARIIGSTVVGQFLDTVTFVVVAFAGTWPEKYIVLTGTSLYGFKVLYEIIATPGTYAIVRFLKKREGIDYFDSGTNFFPFLWSTRTNVAE